MTNRRYATCLMIAQAPLFAIETGMVHRIGPGVSVPQLTLMRSLAGVLLVVILAKAAGRTIIKTERLRLQMLRGFLAAGYFWVMMYSFGRLPFADATAISYTQAAYIAIFSAVILREHVTSLRWTAATIGLLGAALVVKPAFPQWNAIYLVALFGTSLNALVFILNRDLQRADGDGALTTMFYANAVPLACNLPLAIAAPLPDPAVLPWLLGVVIFGPAGVYCGTVALRHADASMLGPYTFLRLPIGIAGGVLIFHEVPDWVGLIGIGLIVSSCCLAMSRQTRAQPAKPDPVSLAWERPPRFHFLQKAMEG